MPPDEHDAARLGEVEPLVRARVTESAPLDAREEVPRGRRRGGGNAAGPVDVQPDVARLADVGEGVDRVDCAGERVVPAVATTATGTTPAVGPRRSRPQRRPDAAAARRPARASAPGRSRARAAPRSERLSSAPRPSSRARAAHVEHPGAPGARDRALTGCRERGDVRDRPPLVNAPPRRVADERAHPAHGPFLDRRGGTGPDRQVHVEAGCEQVAQHADLEPGRADEGEEPGSRCAIDESSRCAASSSAAIALDAPSGSAARRSSSSRPSTSGWPGRAVEAPPGAGDDRGGALERLVARGVEPQRGELGGGAHPRESSSRGSGTRGRFAGRAPEHRRGVDHARSRRRLVR